jgi:hypothetical protein
MLSGWRLVDLASVFINAECSECVQEFRSCFKDTLEREIYSMRVRKPSEDPHILCRDLDIIYCCLLQDQNNGSLSGAFGLSRNRIYQVLNKMVRRLKYPPHSIYLRLSGRCPKHDNK